MELKMPGGFLEKRRLSPLTSRTSSTAAVSLQCVHASPGPPCLYLCEEKHDSTPHLLPTRFSLLFPHSSAPPSRHGRHGRRPCRAHRRQLSPSPTNRATPRAPPRRPLPLHHRNRSETHGIAAAVQFCLYPRRAPPRSIVSPSSHLRPLRHRARVRGERLDLTGPFPLSLSRRILTGAP